MKKILISSFAAILLITTVFVACKKSSDTLSNTTINHLARGIETKINVNKDFNFIVFDKIEDYEKLYKQFVGNTHGDVREYLRTAGFTSLGNSLFENIASDEPVTGNQAVHYLLNVNGVVQIQDLVMKPANETETNNDWTYLLTAKPSSLNTEVYEHLANNNYSSSLMNRFASGIDVTNGLFYVAGEQPTGFDNYDNGNSQRRPFWGSVSTCEDRTCTNPLGQTYACSFSETKKYICWVLVSTGHGDNDGAHFGTCAENGY